MRLLVLIMLVSLVPTVGAADDPTEANLESLIAAADTPAEQRVEALLALAERHRDAGFKRKALPVLTYALTLRDAVSQSLRARLHTSHGALLHDLGLYTEAIASIETALGGAHRTVAREIAERTGRRLRLGG